MKKKHIWTEEEKEGFQIHIEYLSRFNPYPKNISKIRMSEVIKINERAMEKIRNQELNDHFPTP